MWGLISTTATALAWFSVSNKTIALHRLVAAIESGRISLPGRPDAVGRSMDEQHDAGNHCKSWWQVLKKVFADSSHKRSD